MFDFYQIIVWLKLGAAAVMGGLLFAIIAADLSKLFQTWAAPYWRQPSPNTLSTTAAVERSP